MIRILIQTRGISFRAFRGYIFGSAVAETVLQPTGEAFPATLCLQTCGHFSAVLRQDSTTSASIQCREGAVTGVLGWAGALLPLSSTSTSTRGEKQIVCFGVETNLAEIRHLYLLPFLSRSLPGGKAVVIYAIRYS